MLEFVTRVTTLTPGFLAALGALVVILTGAQALCLALGKLVPGSSAVGHFLGVAAIDLGKAVEYVRAFAGWLARLFGPKDPPAGGGTTTRIIGGIGGVALVLLLLPGCCASLEETRGSVRVGVAPELVQRCQDLDDAHRDWGAAAKGAGVLAGGLGAAEALPGLDDKGRLALAGGALVAGGVAAFAVVESEGAATSWARECR